MHKESAHSLREKFVSGDVSASEIASTFLGRIQKEDEKLGSFLHLMDERAKKKAKQLDEKRAKKEPLGRLAGVPIAIKDNIAIKGEKLTCASKFLSDFRALYDATVVELLEKEDAILIGKTNMDEFAMGASGIHSAYYPAKNPWNLACSPGGSSSGSAACVSALFTPLSLGSDTGGSVRQPAAMTGICGFRPTYGRVSRFGLVAFSSSLDQIGPFARNVADTALIMDVIGAYCERDATSIPNLPANYKETIQKPIDEMTIGIPWSFLQDLEGEPRENFEESLNVFKSLGAKIIDVNLDRLKYGIAVYYILTSAEASTNLARFDGIRYGKRSDKATSLQEIYDFSRQEGFGEEVKNRILLGTYVLSGGHKAAFYAKAQKVRTLIIEEMRQAFGKCSIIALPTTPNPAFPLDAMSDPLEEYLQDLYTAGAPIAGAPAISIPSGFSKKGLPFGLQLMGPQTRDDLVLQFAHAFEKATDFVQFPKEFGGMQ